MLVVVTPRLQRQTCDSGIDQKRPSLLHVLGPRTKLPRFSSMVMVLALGQVVHAVRRSKMLRTFLMAAVSATRQARTQ